MPDRDSAATLTEPGRVTGARWRRLLHLPRWAVIVLAMIVLVVVLTVVVPQYGAAMTAFRSMEALSVPLLLLALVLELSSLLVFSAMTRTVLGAIAPGYATLLRIDLVDLGVNHVVPGGGTTAAAARYALLRRARVPGADALSAASVEVLASNLMLGVMFVSGLVMTVAGHGITSAEWAALAVTVGLILITLITCGMLVRRRTTSIRLLRLLGHRVPLVPADAIEHLAVVASMRLQQLLEDPRRLTRLSVLAAANWLLDAAALWVVLAAFGAALPIGVILAVYGIGSLLAMLPVTPGGLGIVEGIMVPALVAFGTAPSPALLGVVGWRLLEYWLPIPLAVAAYISLRISEHPGRRPTRS